MRQIKADGFIRPTLPPMLDQAAEGSSRSQPGFLKEVRDFLAVALTPDLREAGRRTTGVHSDIDACRVWHERLHRRGWIASAWPSTHGGTGWSPAQRLLFERECAMNDAPVLFASGLRSLGPLLIAMGTPYQRRRYLPAILDGRDLWCQGFSEPGAGSDLAALQTRAVSDGDHYSVTGAKIWTTGAQVANRMFCLVRTASRTKPQEGITFLLIDMASPGLSIRPIRMLSGDEEFCEVFFDDVRVPIANRVGEENEGWSVAKRLMSLARSNNTTSGHLHRALRRAASLIASHGRPGSDALHLRASELECDVRTFEAMEFRSLTRGSIDATTASVMKTCATELHQKITTLALEAAGDAAMPANIGALPARLGEGALSTAKYLATRAASIYSGTNETHRNLIARQMLAI